MKHQNEVAPSRGFSLIELMITLALIATVVALGYQLFGFIDHSFKEGEQNWIAQQEARKIADWLDSSLKNSYTVLIYENNNTYSASTVFSNTDEYLYVYLADDARLYFRNSKATSPQLLADVPVGINFSIATSSPSTPKKALSFLISMKKNDLSTDRFTLSSTTNFANMLRSSGVNLLGGSAAANTKTSGNVVKFLNNTQNLNSIQVNTSSCFIATATYGAPQNLPVRILRQFRDRFLLTNEAGKSFVAFYYRNSPPYADYIADKPALRVVVALLLLPAVLIALIMILPQSLLFIPFILVPFLLLRSRRKSSPIASKGRFAC